MGPRASLDVLVKKKALVYTGTRTPDRPPHSLVTVPTEICQILV
jgi:hypothetical protein